jgi:hypothetical protein
MSLRQCNLKQKYGKIFQFKNTCLHVFTVVKLFVKSGIRSIILELQWHNRVPARKLSDFHALSSRSD